MAELHRRAQAAAAGTLRRLLVELLPRVPDSRRRRMVPLLRFAYDFQISARAVALVRDRLVAGGGLLVFGVGQDSSTWELVNPRGRTVFLEDSPRWIDFAKDGAPTREVYSIKYETTVGSSMGFTDVSEIPLPSLPEGLASARWDVVVVDGPEGWGPDTPGRAASITLAHSLMADGGIVLVDDYERELERRICDLAFGRPADELIDPNRPVALFSRGP